MVIPIAAMVNQFVYPAQNAALPRIAHDPQLGEHVTGGPRYAAPDGGVATPTNATIG